MADVVEKVLEQNLLRAAKVVEQQLDDEIDKLEKMDDDDLEVLKQRRLTALKKQAKQRGEWIQMGHGEYSELSNEKEFFEACKKSQNFVCHFYRPTTFRCKIVDKHLSILAKKHVETRFCKINAENSPFLTERLKVKVLPTIVLCKDAKTKDYIIGFDDLGGTDEFPTEMLEWRIAQSAVIDYSEDLLNPPGSAKRKNKTVFGARDKTIRGNTADTDSDED